ncbi:hypothetical protein LTR74_016741 [Friedmanniomyces endolithicus]|nr:hypothetical protein LTR74_016741 [Friedmanniomyces endolithicus]
MAPSLNSLENRNGGREEVLQGLFAGRFSPHAAAETLASISMSAPELVGNMWEAIFAAARVAPEHRQKLVDVLVRMAKLPSRKNEHGEQMILYGEEIWEDLPTIGWVSRDAWEYRRPQRRDAAADFVNTNVFLACMEGTGISTLSQRSFALWTMRPALEYPGTQLDELDPLEFFVPAAAAWIKFAGSAM